MIEGKAFDSQNPRLSVTDPQGLGLNPDYPRHLHRVGQAEDGGPLYVVVENAQQEADAVAEGWSRECPPPSAAPAKPRGPAPKRPGA